jgi:hypothetical protein
MANEIQNKVEKAAQVIAGEFMRLGSTVRQFLTYLGRKRKLRDEAQKRAQAKAREEEIAKKKAAEEEQKAIVGKVSEEKPIEPPITPPKPPGT